MDGCLDDHLVWVGNLNPGAEPEDLLNHFSQIGQPLEAKVLMPGVGLVSYGSSEEAAEMAAQYDQSEIGGDLIFTDLWSNRKDQHQANKGRRNYGKGQSGGQSKQAWAPNKAQYGDSGGHGKWPGYGNGGKAGHNAVGGGKGCGGGWQPSVAAAGWKGVQSQNDGWGKGYANKPAQQQWASSGDGWGGRQVPKAFAGSGAQQSRGRGGWSQQPATPMVFQVESGGNANLSAQGLLDDTVAMVYEKSEEAYSCSHHILSEIIEDVKAEVEYIHDADWEQFPEVGQSLQEKCNEEHCITVAVVASRSVWAVGAAAGWKGRESAARLALAVKLVEGDHAAMDNLVRKHPEFAAFCSAQGLLARQPRNQWGGGGKKRKKQAGGDWDGAAASGGDWEGAGGDWTPSLESEPPRLELLDVGMDSSLVSQNFSPNAYAVEHQKASKEYFSNAHNILLELVEDISTNVVFNDDPEWKNFPEVGEALKRAGYEDNGYCVAVSENFAAWGVGVASGWKARETAAKLALGIAIAFEQGKDVVLAQTYPEFARVLEAGGILNTDVVPATKRARGEF